MRFDRRKTYPTSDVESQIEVLKAIVPERVGGIIKSRGPANLPMNRVVGRVGHPYSWMLPAQRMNHGGTSEQFGSDYVSGLTFESNEQVVFRYNFGIDLGGITLINATSQIIPNVGIELTAVAAANFGLTITANKLGGNQRVVGIMKKTLGTFDNWQGIHPAGVFGAHPVKALTDHKQAVSSIAILPKADGSYGIEAINNVSIGDKFIFHAIAIITKVPVNTEKRDVVLIPVT